MTSISCSSRCCDRRQRRWFYPGLITSLFLALILVISPVNAHAADDEAGAWLIFSNTGVFGPEGDASRWHYWLDLQVRHFDLNQSVNQYKIRPAIGYSLKPNLSVWGGYARVKAVSESGTNVSEDRIYQQLSWKPESFGQGKVSFRARLEQRSVSSGSDLGWRARLQAKFQQPLDASGKTSLVIGIEPFYNLNDTDWSGDSGLSQNRTFLGVAWRVNSKFTLESGYMNQYIWRNTGNDRNNHLFILNVKAKL